MSARARDAFKKSCFTEGVDATMANVAKSVRYLTELKQELSVFSSDSIEMLKRSVPKSGFRSSIITTLAEVRSKVCTKSLYDKYWAVKTDLIAYIDTKINVLKDPKESDPWIVLKNLLSLPINLAPSSIIDHIQDVLMSAHLVAKHEFDLGRLSTVKEVKLLHEELVRVYLPAIYSMPESIEKNSILKAFGDLGDNIEAMGQELELKNYKEVITLYNKVNGLLPFQGCVKDKM